MRDDELPEEMILSESQFREIIERATRADVRDDGISIAVLRQVAEELDIDPRALQRALGDVVGVADRKRPVRGWFLRQITNVGRLFDYTLPKRGRLAAGIVLGTSLGWLCAHVAVGLRVVIAGTHASIGSSSFVDVPVWASLLLLTLANSLSRRLDGRFGRYVAEVAGMWGAFAIAWSVTAGGATNDLVTATLLSVGLATLWGLVVIRRRPARPSVEHADLSIEISTALTPAKLTERDPMEQRVVGRWISLIVLGFTVPELRRIRIA